MSMVLGLWVTRAGGSWIRGDEAWRRNPGVKASRLFYLVQSMIAIVAGIVPEIESFRRASYDPLRVCNGQYVQRYVLLSTLGCGAAAKRPGVATTTLIDKTGCRLAIRAAYIWRQVSRKQNRKLPSRGQLSVYR